MPEEIKYIPPDNGGNWKETYLPEDLRNEKFFETIPDVPTLAKVAFDTKKMQGGMVKIPDNKATEQELENFYSRTRPESPDKYEIKPVQLPEGVEYDKELEKQFLSEVAFKAGLSNRQAQRAIDWWNNTVVALSNEARKEQEAVSNQLKQEWGREFDGNIGLAKQAALKLGGQEYAEGFDNLDNTTKKVLAQISRMTGNDNLVSGQTTSPTSKAEAQAKIDEIMGNKDHPYHRRDKPGHERATYEMSKLYQILTSSN